MEYVNRGERTVSIFRTPLWVGPPVLFHTPVKKLPTVFKYRTRVRPGTGEPPEEGGVSKFRPGERGRTVKFVGLNLEGLTIRKGKFL